MLKVVVSAAYWIRVAYRRLPKNYRLINFLTPTYRDRKRRKEQVVNRPDSCAFETFDATVRFYFYEFFLLKLARRAARLRVVKCGRWTNCCRAHWSVRFGIADFFVWRFAHVAAKFLWKTCLPWARCARCSPAEPADVSLPVDFAERA